MAERSPHDHEVVHQFTRQAEGYSRLTRPASQERQQTLAALLGASADDLVLDVACGPGSLALDLAPCVQWVTGIDLTPAMLEQARAEQQRRALPNVSWQVANAGALPFAEHGFSLVACRAAFHHMEEPRRVFAEMVRVCRPGGRIAVIDVAPRQEESAAYDAVERQRDSSHVHAHTEAELRALGEALPVQAPAIHTRMTPHLSFDAILATSHPRNCTRADVRAIIEDDARSGQNRLGMDTRFIDGELRVSYPMATAIWMKLPSAA